MAEPLLTKDSVNIAGHKLPLAVVGVVVGIAGLILVLRARQRGTNVVSVGQAPGGASANPSAFDPNSMGYFSGSQDAQLANLQQGLSQLSGQLNQAPVTAPTPPHIEVLTGRQDFQKPADWGDRPDVLPLWGGGPGQADVVWVPRSTQLEVTGAIDRFGIPVNYQGHIFRVDSAMWTPSIASVHPTSYQPTAN